jgi:hypothetical protein
MRGRWEVVVVVEGNDEIEKEVRLQIETAGREKIGKIEGAMGRRGDMESQTWSRIAAALMKAGKDGFDIFTFHRHGRPVGRERV